MIQSHAGDSNRDPVGDKTVVLITAGREALQSTRQPQAVQHGHCHQTHNMQLFSKFSSFFIFYLITCLCMSCPCTLLQRIHVRWTSGRSLDCRLTYDVYNEQTFLCILRVFNQKKCTALQLTWPLAVQVMIHSKVFLGHTEVLWKVAGETCVLGQSDGANSTGGLVCCNMTKTGKP